VPLAAVLLAALAAAASAGSKPSGQKVEVRRHLPPPPAVPVAPVRVVEGRVEHGRGEEWKSASGEFRLAPGESLRTGADALALVMFPWMQILIAGDSVVGLNPSTVLSFALERGRIEQRSSRTDILKVVTPEAEVRGRGVVVVRRDAAAGITRVSAEEGRFVVKSAHHGSIVVPAGEGAVLSVDDDPDTSPLGAAPRGLVPGADPVYVEKGRPARLVWAGGPARYHVQVLSLAGDEVLLAREVGAPEIEVPTQAPGTFQWRVAAIDERGLEGRPSAAGLFCVVEK
jgi:hypothetical protein